MILYEKAGYVGKSLDLAFETKQHNVLQYIATNFNENTDPALLDKTAGFFLQHEQYDKAVDLYVASVQAIKALELCLQYNITINEDMAEKLSSGEKFEKFPTDEKTRVLNKIAEVSYQQGNYHLGMVLIYDDKITLTIVCKKLYFLQNKFNNAFECILH